MDLTSPQIIMRDREIARLREELAAAQATIAEMREAIGAWERAEAGQELQEAEAKLIVIMNIESNLDALHEARALECERLAEVFEPGWIKNMLDREAAAHRARKQTKEEGK